MKIFRALFVLVILGLTGSSNAQTSPITDELPLITRTLMDYIDGTANGDPE